MVLQKYLNGNIYAMENIYIQTLKDLICLVDKIKYVASYILVLSCNILVIYIELLYQPCKYKCNIGIAMCSAASALYIQYNGALYHRIYNIIGHY